MSIRLEKAWIAAADVGARLKGTMGVFELGDANGNTIFIGFAGGRSQFGLKGDVAAALQEFPEAELVRYEVTTAYHTRYRELLMTYKADHEALPRLNSPLQLGRLSPA